MGLSWKWEQEACLGDAVRIESGDLSYDQLRANANKHWSQLAFAPWRSAAQQRGGGAKICSMGLLDQLDEMIDVKSWNCQRSGGARKI